MPQVDRTDPAAGYLATLAGLAPGAAGRGAVSAVTGGGPECRRRSSESAEIRLALARARIETGDTDGAAAVLAEPGRGRPGRLAGRLVQRPAQSGRRADAAAARGRFAPVYDELPGELAPKLALAFAAEAATGSGRR